MKINLKRLKLHPRESENFIFSSKGDEKYIAELGGKFLTPIEVELSVENTGTLFVGRGRLSTIINLPCSRCLKEYAYLITTDFDMVMAEDLQDSRLSPDEGLILFQGDQVDLKAEINQAVYLAIPISPVCMSDCRGLCPQCGNDRNVQTCNCEDSNLDPRWEKLKNLR